LTDTPKIPESLKIFFQEVDPSQLDLVRDAETIIERTLRFGNRTELRWLFNYYDRSRIIAWIRDLGEYRLPERHLVFWRLLLDIEAPSDPPKRKMVWPH
jgi:hypothetical protein